MRCIDFHVHYMPEVVPAEKMLADMDACGMEKAVVLATPDHPRYTLMQLTGDNEQVLELAGMHPGRFVPGCYIDPRNVLEAQTQIRHFHERGVRIFKIWPGHGFSPDDPMIYPVWNVVNELKAGVLLHCGSMGVRPNLPLEVRRSTGFNAKFGQPFLLDAPARCFPDIKFIIAHTAYPWTLEALEMAFMFENIYLDFSCELGREGFNLIEKLRPQRLSWDKFLFGSDSAGMPGEAVRHWTGLFRKKFAAPHKEDFFHGNSARLLKTLGIAI